MAKPLTVQQIDEAVNRRLAYLNFWEYCLYADYDFFSRRPFLQEVAQAFQYVYEEYSKGISRKVSVSMPPRAGKSYITSLFCAWWLGKFPELSVMRNTCTARLYDKFSYDVRSIIRSEKYRSVFPGVFLAGDKQNLDGWNLSTSKQVGYFGAGVGGTIIGFGANLALSDDLYRGIDDALSPTYNDKVIRWKESAHDSRKEKNCPELYIGTRWSVNDVIGIAQDSEKIDKKVVIAALNDKDESFCEEVKSSAEYIEIRNSIDESIWDAEYLQSPIEMKGLLFPINSLQKYNPATVDVAKMAEYRFCFIDPADEGGDDLSAPVGYLVGDKVYIVDVIYNNDGTDVNEPGCVEFLKKHRCDAAEIESNSAWTLFRKSVKEAMERDGSDCDIRSIKNTTNKHTRILAGSAFIRNHFIFREDWKELPEYRKFMQNLTKYMRMDSGKSAHDDAPDSLAGMARYFRTEFAHLWRVKTTDSEE